MTSLLVNALESGRGLDYLDNLPEYVSTVSKEDVIRVLAPCRGHETISIVGPKEYIEPAMQNLKLDYELVDWESRYRSMLDERELKKYLKALEKEEKAKAKAEAEAANAG